MMVADARRNARLQQELHAMEHAKHPGRRFLDRRPELRASVLAAHG